MTIITFDVLASRPVSVPRGAQLAAALYTRLAQWFSKAPAATRAQEAATVRELAQSVQNTDPGFAADLFAAAARHASMDDR